MDSTARDTYLENQILAAPPQKLRLLLIEAALRHARNVAEDLRHDPQRLPVPAAVRCREILAELVAGIDPTESELTKRVVTLYLYLYRELAEAELRRDPARLVRVISVLELERETWALVCAHFPQSLAANGSPLAGSPPRAHDPAPAGLPLNPAASGSQLSLDA